MPRASAAVATTAGAAGRIALATVGIVLLVAALAPKSDPEDVARATVIQDAGRVALQASEDRLSSNLTVVDESDRPLLTLTRWPDGSLAVVPHWSGPSVALWLNAVARTAKFGLTGTSRRTNLLVHPDGKMEVDEKDEPRSGPPAPPAGTAQAGAFGTPDAAPPGP